MTLSLAARSRRELLLLVTLVIAYQSTLLAQRNQQPPKEYLRSSGEILRIAPGFLQVKTKDGGQWVIQVPGKPEAVSVTGTAEANWLQRGMYVRFTGRFDKRGKPSGSINEIQVFTPDKTTKIGVFPDSGLGLETKELFSDDEPAGRPQPGKQPDRNQASAFLIAGRLASLKGGKLSVLAGRTVVQAQLAEKAKISVRVSDARLARVGDLVEIDAWYPAAQKAAGRAIATQLKVTATKPYTTPRRQRTPAKQDSKKEAEKKDGNEPPSQ